MTLDALTAVSPIDGRYRSKTECLADYFSEYALIRYRVRVEIWVFHHALRVTITTIGSFNSALFEQLRDIYRNFDEASAARVKEIESITNHDCKGGWIFHQRGVDKIGGLDDYKEFIHFGLTSQGHQ